MEASLDYVGVGVNRVVNALAWGEHGGVAYAAHHMVALYDVECAKVISTLRGHTGLVNCVLWIPQEATPELASNQHLLVSGAADNTIRLWLVAYTSPSPSPSPSSSSPRASWQCLATLQGHAGPVTSLAVHRLPPSPSSPSSPSRATSPRLLLVSTAGDADVIVWACGGGAGSGAGGAGGDTSGIAFAAGGNTAEVITDASSAPAPGPLPAVADSAAAAAVVSCYGAGFWGVDQRLHVGTRMQSTAALTHLPLDPDWTLLATGGTDRKVTLYVRPPPPSSCSGSSGAGAGAPPPRFTQACVLEGHENWVRGVAFCHVAPAAPAASGGAAGEATAAAVGGPQLLLASVSQDRYGRIWKLQPEPLGTATRGGVEDPLAALIQRYAPKPHVDTSSTRYVATSEALLIGHEDWVHGLQWAPPPPPPPPAATAGTAEASSGGAASSSGGGGGGGGGGGVHTRASAALLTASMDRSMVIWRYEADSGLWMNEASLGDAGASCLGYFGGVWGPGGSAILAHGFTGALHLWRGPPRTCPSPGAPYGPWTPRHALGGHFGAVVDLGWGLDGGCVISVGEDQTARVHTATHWRGGGAGGGGEGGGGAGEEAGPEALHWCEVARAQVHGHDFRCVAHVASPPGSDFVYVSGSEEKVLRVFEAPQAFLDTLVALRGGEASPAGRSLLAQGRRGHGFGASVAALGLSQKAVYEGEGADKAGGGGGGNAGGAGSTGEYADGPDCVPCAAPQVITEPPLEEHLAQNTLWPETHKLYGHGNDVFCAAASPDGRYLASACKAQTAATAAIWVWCTASWRAVAQLRAHTLTVTQLAWSPSGGLLAAASRDRTFSLFRRRDPPASGAAEGAKEAGAAAGDATFELVSRTKAAHGRLIWSVCWSGDERLLATASRDETVKVWRVAAGAGGGDADGAAATAAVAPALAVTLPQFPSAATAVAFAPSCSGPTTSYLLAVGLEDGSLQLWQLVAAPTAAGDVAAAAGGLTASCVWAAGESWRHVAPVRRLAWRGAPGTAAAVAAVAALSPQQEQQREEAEAEGRSLQQLASGSEDHSVRVFTFRVRA